MVKYILSVFISGMLFLTSNQNGSQQIINTSDSTASSADTYQGLTEGSHSVSLTGGFNYSIPIAVAPGVKGVAPNLSLVYNGQGSDGIAGYGWTISGLSSISRLPSTRYHNGYMDPIDLDDNDQFSFDGQRLILKPGTTNQYQTESYSNTKIIKNGDSFTVYYPNGATAYYGTSYYSRDVVEWAISRWEDVNGNKIDYYYDKSGNTLRIKSIRYGHQSGVDAINTVYFDYDIRDNPISHYINGYKVLQRNLLKSITTNGNGQLYRKYELTHDKTLSLNYNRVTSVKEYNGESYASTLEFNYENTTVGISQPSEFSVTNNFGEIESKYIGSVNGDFNADGNQDLILFDTRSKDKLSFYDKTYTSTPSNNRSFDLSGKSYSDFDAIFSTKFIDTNNKVNSKQDGITFVKEKNTSQYDTEVTFTNQIINAYGLVDKGTKKMMIPRTGYGNFYNKQYISGDFNGDGLTDVVLAGVNLIVNTPDAYLNLRFFDLDRRKADDASKMTFYKVSRGRNFDYYLTTGDYNGDGITDLFYFKENEMKVFSLIDDSLQVIASVQDDVLDYGKQVSTGDFNGDGKTDFITPEKEGSTNWVLFTSNSSTGFNQTNHTLENFSKDEEKKYIFSDFTADGKVDFMFIDVYLTTHGRLYYSKIDINGNPIFKLGGSPSFGSNLKKDDPLIGLELDKYNSSSEFGFFMNNGRESKIRTFKFKKDHQIDTRLNYVYNEGNHKKIEIHYAAHDGIADGTYQESDSEVFPYANINSLQGFNLVKGLEEIVNDESYRKRSYKYYGAVSHAEGLGFIGFKGIARSGWYESNKTPNLWSVSLFNPQLRGQMTDTYSILTNPDLTKVSANYITREHYDYKVKLLANPSATIFNNIPVDLTLNQIMNNTFKIASRSIRLTTGFKAQGSKGQFKASIVGNPDQSGASGYAGVYINFPSKVTVYDNLTKVTTTKTYSYDSYWNPVMISTNHGGVGTTEERFEYINNPSVTSGYYMARVKKKTGKTIAYGGSFQSTTEYSYDSKGQATRIIKRGNGGSDALEENLTYDVFGNVKTRSLKGTGVSIRNERFTHDTTGRFITEKIDIEGFKTTYINNASTGQLNSETNHLGLTTSYTYDKWNRPKTVTDYLGKTDSYVYKKQTDGGFIVEESNPQIINKKTYYDSHGRVYQEQNLSLDNQWISMDTQYDVLDRKIKESEPYINGGPTLWTITKYDEYGRIYEAIAPNTRKLTTSYNGLTVSVNDQVQTKTTVKDAMGNTLSNQDNGGKITYTYFPNGNMKTSSYDTGNGINTIVVEQDHWGRKMKLTDPSAGVYQYKYNIFGETLEEINPKGKTTTVYDVNGRITQKTIQDDEKHYTVDYVYDGTTKLVQRVNANTDDTNSVAYVYDNYGRPTKVTEDNSRATYIKEMMYDDFGRAASDKVTAKSKAKNQSFVSTINYNYEYGSGILEKITNSNNKVLYQVDALNQRAQVTKATFGNDSFGEKIKINNEYDVYGYLTKQRHASASYTAMDYQYQFDQKRGNLKSRINYALTTRYEETFGYDSLDRLTTINATTEQSNMTYEKDGRIKTNSTVGRYTYKSSGSIFQLADIDLNTKGKQLFNNRELQEAQFTSFKKPTHIKEAGNGEVWFEYNGGLTRSYAEIKKEDGSQHLIKHYNADQSTEIIEDQLTGKSKIVHYFGGPYESNISYIAEYKSNNQVEKQGFHYLHRDYLGSLVAISDQNGMILEKRHYGAWGKLEKYESNSSELTADSPLLTRGWTGHEHFTQVSLVHMNGRMYDADLGRFLAPDNYVQDPSNTQNFNRYQYAFNNPLKYTDPSGEVLGPLGIIAIGAVVAGASYAINAAITGQWSWDGFIKSVLIGAATAMFSAGIGDAAAILAGIKVGVAATTSQLINQAAIQMAAHSAVGGMFAAGEGGKFWAGAAAGAISSVIASGVGAIVRTAKNISNFIKSTIIVGSGGLSGGIGSALAGGNFWSGVRQGAITAGLNHLLHMTFEESGKEKLVKKLIKKYKINDKRILAESLVADAIIEITDVGELVTEFRENFVNTFGNQKSVYVNEVYSEGLGIIKEIKDIYGGGKLSDYTLLKIGAALSGDIISLQIENYVLSNYIKRLDINTYYNEIALPFEKRPKPLEGFGNGGSFGGAGLNGSYR